MQIDITDAVKKRKRKRNRIVIDRDNSKCDNHRTDTILREQLRRL
jgi:hypothetical protein